MLLIVMRLVSICKQKMMKKEARFLRRASVLAGEGCKNISG